MSVVFTIAAIAAIGAWAFAVHQRLVRLRDRVREAWRHLEADPASDSARTVYNRCVQHYNAALGGFPANLVAMMAGFKGARRYDGPAGLDPRGS